MSGPLFGKRTTPMTRLIGLAALFFLVAAMILYIWRREPRAAAFLICAALGVALTVTNLFLRMS